MKHNIKQNKLFSALKSSGIKVIFEAYFDDVVMTQDYFKLYWN
jgi:hypothetical protein